MLKIILIIVLLLFIGTIWYFYARIRRFARENLGTDSLREFMETQEEQLENTPKSVSGMTSLYLPKLQADFPELNWVELRSMAEKHLKEYLADQNISSPVIHESVLRDYRKNSGTCYVVVQSSVQYMSNEHKVQTRYNTTLAYVQDASQTRESAYSANCPNCGAPVSRLGSKVCEYCGSAIVSVNQNVWKLDSVKEC